MGKFYTQLSIEDRTMIQTQLTMGIKASVIARGLGLHCQSKSRYTFTNSHTTG